MSDEPLNLTITIPAPDWSALTALVAERVAEEVAALSVAPSTLMTVAEVAEYLRCAQQRVYDLVGQGRLEPVRDGRRLLFRRSVVDAYLNGAE